MKNSVPTALYDMLPVPVVVAQLNGEELNHQLIYSNASFLSAIGWTLEDIPDKEHWWQKAYPDPKYQKVVESLWELSMESVDINKDSFVTVTVNIMTKHRGLRRFKVNTELKTAVVDGYYAVVFEEVPMLDEPSI